ncbi:MAG: hypothetical protein ACREJC_09625 [Tepidisphaeraceae bacterium]
MTHIKGTSRQQTKFLRECLKDPTGMSNRTWPSAITMRRWMRRRGFRIAIKGIRDALRFQADVHIAAAAAQGAQCLAQAVAPDGASVDPARLTQIKQHIDSLTTLLRLAHLRQRFNVEPPEPLRWPDGMRRVFREMAHYSTRDHGWEIDDDMTLGEIRERYEKLGQSFAQLEGNEQIKADVKSAEVEEEEEED